ncbi:MAG TPA: hypothetical protein VGB43_08745, partial [Flavobacterium sp.]
YFVRDQNKEQLLQSTYVIADFIKAMQDNRRSFWLKKYFNTDIYSTLSDEDVVADIILKFQTKYESIIYMCENCGRLKVQKGNKNVFITFVPENDDWLNIFKAYENKVS